MQHPNGKDTTKKDTAATIDINAQSEIIAALKEQHHIQSFISHPNEISTNETTLIYLLVNASLNHTPTER